MACMCFDDEIVLPQLIVVPSQLLGHGPVEEKSPRHVPQFSTVYPIKCPCVMYIICSVIITHNVAGACTDDFFA